MSARPGDHATADRQIGTIAPTCMGAALSGASYSHGVSSVNRRDPVRRGARVADRGGLENRCACKRTVGSNPTLSAIKFVSSCFTHLFGYTKRSDAVGQGWIHRPQEGI
jgi:hypothetical protein